MSDLYPNWSDDTVSLDNAQLNYECVRMSDMSTKNDLLTRAIPDLSSDERS